MRRVFALIILAVTALAPSPAHADGHILVVNGVEYQSTKEAGDTIHWETAGDPTSASFAERSQIWLPGDNGSDHLPCPGGIHWISNYNVLTISNCLDVPATTSTTTSSPIVSTSTTTPATTTTVPESTSTSSPTTSTTICVDCTPNTQTVTTVPDTTAPPTSSTATPTSDGSTTTTAAPTTTVNPSTTPLPPTGNGAEQSAWFAVGLVSAGMVLSWLAARRRA